METSRAIEDQSKPESLTRIKMARSISGKTKTIPLREEERAWLESLVEAGKLAKGLGFVTQEDSGTGAETYNRLRQFAIAQWTARGLPQFGYPVNDVRCSDQGANIVRVMKYLVDTMH